MTTQQRDDALELANTIRLGVAEWRRKVAAMPADQATREVIQQLRSTDLGVLGTLRVGRMLTAIHRVGTGRAVRLLADACPFQTTLPERRLRDVPPAVRARIAERLELLVGPERTR